MITKLERMFRAHAALKARLAKENRDHKAVTDVMKGKQLLIETAMLKMMNETGSEQLKVKGVGIAYITERKLPQCKDWNAVYTFVQETGSFDLLAKRLNMGGVNEYVDANGDTPPGVTIMVERGVSVRRDT